MLSNLTDSARFVIHWRAKVAGKDAAGGDTDSVLLRVSDSAPSPSGTPEHPCKHTASARTVADPQQGLIGRWSLGRFMRTLPAFTGASGVPWLVPGLGYKTRVIFVEHPASARISCLKSYRCCI